jgi:riboflavin biosynthesis pyrimidine reductase
LDKSSRGAQPLGIILTTSGDVPLENNLIFHEDQTLLVISSDAISEERAEALGQKAQVCVSRRPETDALTFLRRCKP